MHTMRWGLILAVLAGCAVSPRPALNALARGDASCLSDADPAWTRFTMEAFREMPRYRVIRADRDAASCVFYLEDAWRGAQVRIWFGPDGRIVDWLDLGVGVRGSIARETGAMDRFIELIHAVADREFRRALQALDEIPTPTPRSRGMVEAIRADMLHKLRRWDEARAALERASTDHPPAWFLRGILLDEEGLVADSVPWFEKYLREVGDDPDVLAWLAKAREKLGDFEGAAEAYRRGLDAIPTEDWMRRQYLVLLGRSGRYAELRRAIAERARMEEPMRDLLGRVAYEFRNENQWGALAALARVGVDAAPSDPDRWYDLGLAELRLERPAAAREALLRGMELDEPVKRPAYRRLLIEALPNLGDWEGAREQLEAWAGEDGVSGEPQLERARLETRAGNVEVAATYLREALRLNSGWIQTILTQEDFTSLRRFVAQER